MLISRLISKPIPLCYFFSYFHCFQHHLVSRVSGLLTAHQHD